MECIARRASQLLSYLVNTTRFYIVQKLQKVDVIFGAIDTQIAQLVSFATCDFWMRCHKVLVCYIFILWEETKFVVPLCGKFGVCHIAVHALGDMRSSQLLSPTAADLLLRIETSAHRKV